MRTPLFQKSFPGMKVKVIERQGNPCGQPEIKDHFDCWYRLVVLTTTPENQHVAPGYWHIKLASVKRSWNPLLQKKFLDAHTIIVDRNEVVTNIDYGVDVVEGHPADIVALTMKSLEDGFSYIALIRIHHGLKPLFPMQQRVEAAPL